LASTIVSAQVPLDLWHENIRDPTIADAIMDRLVHNAYKIKIKGESMRKLRSSLTNHKDSGSLQSSAH
jgi:DNA replication protein DnaC